VIRRVELIGMQSQSFGDKSVGARLGLLQALASLPFGVIYHRGCGLLGGLDDRRQSLGGIADGAGAGLSGLVVLSRAHSLS
jgi:hypothetical protein